MSDAANPRRRRAAVVAGALVVAIYVAVAVAPAWFVGLTVRRPLLDDGGGPTVPYRWVNPPAALAKANQEPSSTSVKVPLGSKGSKAEAISTSDVQVTLVVTQGMIATSPGASSVGIDLDPLSPKKFPPAPTGLRLIGNVYRIQGRFLPTKKPLGKFAQAGRVILIYPQLATVHSSGGHKVLYSPDGKTWQAMDTQDIVGLVEAEASIPGPGYVAIGGDPASATSASSTGDGASTVRIAIAVVLGCIALVGIGILIRLIGKKE